MFIFLPPGFKDKESPMDATASKVGSVFREIDVTQPFHNPADTRIIGAPTKMIIWYVIVLITTSMTIAQGL